MKFNCYIIIRRHHIESLTVKYIGAGKKSITTSIKKITIKFSKYLIL